MIKYLIEGIEETFGSQEEANAYIAALGPGVSVQLISDGASQDNNEITADDTILNPDFRQDAAKGADVVSGPQPAQDTESASEDGSLDLPPVETFNIDGREVTKEEFDAYSKKQEEADDEIKTMDNYFGDTWTGLVASGTAALGGQARVSTFLNELAYSTVGNLFLSDEDKEMMSSLDPKVKQAILNAQANASNPLGSIAQSGLEYYEEAKIAEKELRSKMEQFDTTILEDLGQGNIIRGLQRASSSALQSAPSVAQSLFPYIGIASIAAGAAAEASAEAQEEGKDINLKTMLYAGTKGAAEGVLETVTRGIAKGMFKSLTGKSKRFIDKSVKDVVGGIMKDAGMEGGSEGMTEVINVIAENIYLGKETGVLEGVKRVGEAALVGAFMGGKMTGAGAASSVMVNTVQTNKVNKRLDQSEFDSLKDSFDLETGVDQSIVDLVEIRGALGIIENKAKKELREGKITREEANDIVSNFKEIETATKQAKAANIKQTYQPEIVENLAKKNKLNKQIKEINDDALSTPLKDEVNALNKQIAELQGISVREQASTKEKVAVEKLKKVAKDFDVEITEVDQEGANKIRSELAGKPKESTAYGFIYTDKNNKSQIVLNKDQIFTDAVINTGAHEFLHYTLNTMFNSANKDASIKELSNSIDNILKSPNLTGNKKGYEKRIEGYKEAFEKEEISEAAFFEEKLVVLSEAMLDGEFDVKNNPGIIARLKELARRMLSALGVKAEFNTDQDVLNFIKDYNRSMRKGKLTRGQKKTLRDGAKGKLITDSKTKKKKETVKESMSPKMRKLLDRKEATEDDPYMDPETKDNELQGINQQINELKETEATQNKRTSTKAKPSGPMTLEEADAAYEDALEAWEDAPDNDFLLEEVEKALKEVEAAKTRFDEGMEAPIEVKTEDKSVAKPVREKKDRSTKRYTLTDQAKAKVEPLIEKAQAMNKELIAKEKKLNNEKIAAIRATPETEMTRTEQANAVLQAKANPIRLDKPVELRRLEAEIQDRLEKPMGKAVTFFTKLLYDKIPKEAANVIGGRDVYKSAAEARLLNIVINEFKKNTVNRAGEKTVNDVEDILFNRGGLRLLTLATDLGVADSKQGIAGAIDENKVGDYGDWDKAFDDSPVEMDVDGMFRVSSLLGDSGRMAQAMEQVAEFWKDNIGNSPIENFKKLPSLIDNIVADMLNISENVLTARSGNLNKEDYTNALKGITKPYAVFKVEGKEIRVAPEFAGELENRLRNEGKSFERFADQNILQTLFKFLPKLSADDYRYADRTRGRYSGKATGVPKNLVKLTYSGLERGTTGMGNMKARVSKVAYKDVLAAMGGFVNPDGEISKLANVSGRTPEGQTLLGVIKLMNRMITNDISRNSNMGLDPMTVQDIAAGKNDLMMSLKRSAKPMQVTNPELQALLNKYNKNNPKASYINQIDHIHNEVKGMVGDHLAGIFNYDVRTWLEKNAPESLAEVAKAYDFRWGKFFNYVKEDLSFNKAIEEISTNKPDTPTLEKFFVLYARSIKNKKYKGAMNNQLLWELVSDNIEGGEKKLIELGFTLRQSRNKKGELGKRFYIDVTKEVKNDKGENVTITGPVSSPLSVTKIKKEHKREELDKGSIDAVGLQTIEDSNRYVEIILAHIKELVESGQTLRAIADIHTMAQGQLTPIRKLSTLGKVYKFDKGTVVFNVKGKKIKLTGDSILEHVDSVKLLQNRLLDVVNGKMSPNQFREYVKNQKVDVIPKEADPKLKVGTKEQKYTPIEKALLATLPLYEFDAEAARVEQENQVKAENANEGFAQSMKRTPDTKRKGISVLDFDDTLARTNSNVLYTMPNGKTGKLTAEEFAKNGDMMSSKGAEWDFSEFSKVVDGKSFYPEE